MCPPRIPYIVEDKKDYLVDGFTYGFSLHFDGVEEELTGSNSKTALLHPDIVEAKINEEIAEGRIAGPYHLPPFHNFKSSPLALRPKSDPNKFRLLHNLSYPYDNTSVNSGILSIHTSVNYSSIWDALNIAISHGKGGYLAKNDIAHAFKIIPLHPSMYHLTGFTWNGLYYYDMTLPQGASPSCKIFEEFSSALSWILSEKYNVRDHVKYLDDFIFLAPTPQLCLAYQQSFEHLCKSLGVPIAPNKTVRPCQRLNFLGIEIDMSVMQARLPPDKLSKYSDLIRYHLTRQNITLSHLQKLIGCLHFCIIVTVGKPYIRRIIDKTKGLTKPFHHTWLTNEVKEDLTMWLHFLENYNGRHFLREKIITHSSSFNLHTDACPGGFGITFGSSWVQSSYPLTWSTKNIAFLELYPIYVAVEMFGSKMKNSHIIFHCDNQAIVSVINKQSSKEKHILTLLRKLLLSLMHFNIYFKVQYLHTYENIACDRISRSQVTPQLLMVYGVQPLPTPMPQHLLPEHFTM